MSASPPLAHWGSFSLAGPLQRIWHPGLIVMRATNVGIVEIRTRWWERGGIQALISRRCCARGGHLDALASVYLQALVQQFASRFSLCG